MKTSRCPRGRNLLLLGALVSALSTGCSNDCPAEDPISFKGGFTDPTRTFYRSSNPDGPFLHFPGGRVYDLVHGLRETPSLVLPFVSFSQNGSMSVSPGNQSVISIDDKIVRVQNATCAEFYLFVVATTLPLVPPDADAGSLVDAGAE